MAKNEIVTDVATRTDGTAVRSAGMKKVPAKINADRAKGAALATVCLRYATERVQAEEREAGKLKTIIADIAALTHDGHLEFRSHLQHELEIMKELSEKMGISKAETNGYMYSSFKVLCSNWRTISFACDMGYKPGDKGWSQVLKEAVAYKQAHSANAGEGPQSPSKRKAGRKPTSLIKLAKTAASKLLTEGGDGEFAEFAAWVSKQLEKVAA